MFLLSLQAPFANWTWHRFGGCSVVADERVSNLGQDPVKQQKCAILWAESRNSSFKLELSCQKLMQSKGQMNNWWQYRFLPLCLLLMLSSRLYVPVTTCCFLTQQVLKPTNQKRPYNNEHTCIFSWLFEQKWNCGNASEFKKPTKNLAKQNNLQKLCCVTSEMSPKVLRWNCRQRQPTSEIFSKREKFHCAR